ncbi:hypothetical protein AVEN_158975-1 [Araneus ventricosus]|uniref:Uncharacterized protein n=1 Tax=Araneus ventricosus TaxID=182803 RepID=A0A4Y2BA13_ARAVE|nr:hypothetical protein AVEN_158975-1 [Araneus ventricosus]
MRVERLFQEQAGCQRCSDPFGTHSGMGGEICLPPSLPTIRIPPGFALFPSLSQCFGNGIICSLNYGVNKIAQRLFDGRGFNCFRVNVGERDRYQQSNSKKVKGMEKKLRDLLSERCGLVSGNVSFDLNLISINCGLQEAVRFEGHESLNQCCPKGNYGRLGLTKNKWRRKLRN